MRFAYQLGAHFKILNVQRDILDKLPASEFLRWEAYSQMEPFGEWRADVRSAQIVAMIHNMAQTKKENLKGVGDFVLDWKQAYDEAEKKRAQAEADAERPKRQTWQEKLAIAQMWFNAFAGGAKEQQ